MQTTNDRIIVAIGGGELKSKQTLGIDAYIAGLAKDRAGEKRANALFIGTASHDYMPYYNTFHKTYTGEFGLKTDCLLLVRGETPPEKIKAKFDAADMIYVGGGNTPYMLGLWEQTGVLDLIKEAYGRGVILSGLSAGAICWYENMYTDGDILSGNSCEYSFKKATGILKGCACPHFDERRDEFLKAVNPAVSNSFICMENLSAVVYKRENLVGALSAGGKAYRAEYQGENLKMGVIELI
ncbi:MAG: Type 1 glutamine amidotransferase-like domain-containing protein [Clostridia bacterium]|nr:Type 1 glutamine amidotransferase-like domain-containing protein [Clostridia bacterium]